MLTIQLVTDRDIIIRSWYLGDVVREIFILLFGDTSPIRDGIARDYYIIIYGTHHRLRDGVGRYYFIIYFRYVSTHVAHDESMISSVGTY